jgi:selenocysteine-specific elongation factor
MKRSIIIGTAGHIDHGKTALVKALTGVDTDRLPEEKARGITIDIGFAHSNWEGVDISFIDVPGHERFIKNMLAGIGGIHLVMLVIAADESVMPQTREHFDICRLLHIPKGVIVITKTDLVDAETIALVEEEIRELVHGSFLQGAPIFRVSARTGQGLEELKKGLAQQIATTNMSQSTSVFRLPIDRTFTLKGHGTIVTGTLLSGSIRREAAATLMPSEKQVKVRSVHAHDQRVDAAFSGERTALNLQGVEKDEIQRGDVLVEPGIFRVTSLLDAKIYLLPHSKPLKHNALVRLHHLTNDVPARITLPGVPVLEPDHSAFAQLRLQHPIHAMYGDRFILRKHSPLSTIAGGIILDHLPSRRISAGDVSAITRLKGLENISSTDRLAFAVDRRGLLGADESYLKAKMGMTAAEIRLLQPGSVLHLRSNPLLAVDRKAAEDLSQKIRSTVQKFHEQNPLQFGIPKEELRSRLLKSVSPEVFSAVLDRALELRQFLSQKDLISLPGRKISLDDSEETLASQLEDSLRRSGLETVGVEEFAQQMKQPQTKIRNLLYLLVRRGQAVKISEDYFLHKNTWEALKQKIREFKSSRKSFSVPDFKAMFQVSRKFAIPLLETLDREGVTRRSGNERIIL